MHAVNSRERGFGILEMSLALALFTMILLFSMRDQQRTARMQVDRAAGEHLKIVQLALQRYLDQNRAELLAGTAIAGIADPVAPTLPELRAVNALAPSVGDMGPNGLTYQLRVDRLPLACVPSTNCVDLQGVMWATTPLLEGAVPQAQRLAIMQSAAGIDAAIANVTNSAELSGLDGIWPIPNPLGNQPGVIAARAGWGASTDLGAFLRRDGSDAGMVGNLQMNSNRIDNPGELAAPAAGNVRFTVGGVETGRVQENGLAVAASLQFQSVVVPAGACAQAGSLGRVATADGNGVALCDAGVWRTLALQANLGAACSTDGAAALAPNGQQIICWNGTYVASRDRMTRVVQMDQFPITHSQTIQKPQCGPGGSANVVVIPQDPGTDPSWAGIGPAPFSATYGEANRMQILTSQTPATWTVQLRLVDESNNPTTHHRISGNQYNLQAIAVTQCIY